MECEMHGVKGQSAYFRGAFRGYGRHQWYVKYYDWQSEQEIESAHSFFFGDDDWGGTRTDRMEHIIGRTIPDTKWYFAGRSGGWLVINEELSPEEVERVSQYVANMLSTGLSDFLKEERAQRAAEALEAERAETVARNFVATDPRIRQALALIKDAAGPDYVFRIRGISVED